MADSSPVHTIQFGTDGWRGLIDSEINSTTVAVAAQAFVTYLRERHTVPSCAVGFDNRRDSDLFAATFASVLSANGIRTELSDRIIPTPALSWYIRAHGLSAGVMVTASHNPPEYNGIKFKASYGGPFVTEQTHRVEELLGTSPVRSSPVPPQPVNLLRPWMEHLERRFDFDRIRSSGITVLVDSMGGAGGTLLEELLGSCGCTVRTLDGTPSPDFHGRNAEPIERNLGPLRDELRRGGWSLGVATDGDADRLGVLLEDGSWLSAQETILLLADHVKTVRGIPGDLVKTSSVTHKLNALFSSAGCRVRDVQVGFKYICETMIASNVAFGCEESGGYGFGDHMPERDGLYSALMVIEMLAESGCATLGEFVARKRSTLGAIHYDRIDLEDRRPNRLDVLPSLAAHPPAAVAGFRVHRLETYDSSRGIINGVKLFLEGSTRWLLMRASETEPLLRFYAEGESDSEVRAILNAGVGFAHGEPAQTGSRD